MDFRKTRSMYPLVLLTAAILLLPPQVSGSESEWITFHDNISSEKQRIPIKLTFTDSGSQFYSDSKSNLKSTDIDPRKNDDYNRQIDLGTAIDGNHYKVKIKDNSEIKIISSGSERFFTVRVLQIKESNKEEVVKEGVVVMNRDVEIPLEAPADKIGVKFDTPLKGTLEINFYNNNPLQFEARTQTTFRGSLSGSTSAEEAFIEASITCGNSLNLYDRRLALGLKPFDQKMPTASTQAKLSDLINLGGAKLVVEKIRQDCSELVLALLDGELIVPRQQIESVACVGEPFPAFARVELVRRKLMTLNDLTTEAGAEGYVALIFGDFKPDMSPNYGGIPPFRYLTLNELMVADILKKDCEKPVVLAFVCRQLSLSNLYETWLRKDPEFYILSDYSNPLNTQFISSTMEPHMYMRPPNDRDETLRNKLKFQNETIVTALIDANGGLVYLNTNAAPQLADALVQMNTLIKNGFTSESIQSNKGFVNE